MKKLLGLILGAATMLGLAACSSKTTLKVLNWGDYINEDVVKSFEKENNCNVKIMTSPTNEDMYLNIKTKKAKYDIAVPSDYMINKLKNENLLNQIDKSKLTNYTDGMFRDSLETLITTDGADYKDYFIPYFWGSLGIMYNKQKDGLEDIIKANGFKVLFDQSILPSGTKVGMYASSRDAFAAAEAYLGYSFNTTTDTELKECKDLLKANSKKYSMWGDDDLKTNVASGNLDLALVYSGDYFDQRYQYLESNKDADSLFGLYAPTEKNNVFYDGLVIPKTSENIDLAHKFIDFFLDTENSFENTDYVGYAPVIEAVYQKFISLAAEETDDDKYYTELLAIDAFDPSKVTGAEVYKFISVEYDDNLEEYYTEIRGN